MITPSTRHPMRTQAKPWRAQARRQRGAVTIIGAVTLLMGIVFMALALDAGRLWLERRNLQKTADFAAMESARFTGCGSSYNDALAAVNRSVSTNGIALSDGTVTVAQFDRGQITRDKVSLLPVFTPIAGASDATNGTHVVLTKTVAASLIAGGLPNSKFLGTTAIKAEAFAEGGPPTAAFSVGSFASISQKQADVITKLFAGILGNSSLNLTLDSLTALGQSTITLAELQAQAGAKSLDELLNMQVSPATLLTWIRNSTTMSQASKDALSQIISVSAGSSLQIKLGDVLNVQLPATGGVAQASLNVLDLVNTSLIVGQGSNLINLGLNIPLVGSIKIGFMNPPKIAVGAAGKSASGNWCTEAKSTQMQLIVAINPLKLGLVDMALRVNLAATSGHLENLNIAAGNTTGSISADSTLADLALTKSTDATKPASVAGGLVTVGLNLPLFEGQGGYAPFTLRSIDALPLPVKTTGVAGSSIAGLLGADTSLSIKVLGIGGDLFAPLVKLIISPILSVIGNDLIDPLFSALGIDLGLVKVTLTDVTSPVMILRQ